LIDSWDIDLNNFGMEIVLNRRLAPSRFNGLEFVEKEPDGRLAEEPGLGEFLCNPSMRGDAREEEIAFLEKTQVQSISAYRSLLLPRIAESQRPAQF
jgi:hypothetical protein